jgi:hypothetical protein
VIADGGLSAAAAVHASSRGGGQHREVHQRSGNSTHRGEVSRRPGRWPTPGTTWGTEIPRGCPPTLAAVHEVTSDPRRGGGAQSAASSPGCAEARMAARGPAPSRDGGDPRGRARGGRRQALGQRSVKIGRSSTPGKVNDRTGLLAQRRHPHSRRAWPGVPGRAGDPQPRSRPPVRR